MKCNFDWTGDFFSIIPFAQGVVQSGGTITIRPHGPGESAQYAVFVDNMTVHNLGPIVRAWYDEGCSDEDLEVYLYEED